MFDTLQTEGKRSVIRIKAGTTKTLIKEHEVNIDSIVFYNAEVLLGTTGNNNQTKNLSALSDIVWMVSIAGW